jgi:uncharacterized protein (TIGR02145 family)
MKSMMRNAIGFYMMPKRAGVPIVGWHVPTKTECDILMDYCGGWQYAGGHFKESGTTHWVTSPSGQDNSSGLTILGNSYRSESGEFGTGFALKSCATAWAIDEMSSTTAWAFIDMVDGDNTHGRGEANKKRGMGVRYIKDDSTDPGTLTDIDGNVYPTVKIGNQVWMAANLKVKHFNNGDPIPLVTNDSAWAALTTPGMCWYLNNIVNKSIYGGLYNWYFVNHGL